MSKSEFFGITASVYAWLVFLSALTGNMITLIISMLLMIASCIMADKHMKIERPEDWAKLCDKLSRSGGALK